MTRGSALTLGIIIGWAIGAGAVWFDMRRELQFERRENAGIGRAASKCQAALYEMEQDQEAVKRAMVILRKEYLKEKK